MRVPGAHVLRELRDQRSILLGVFVALPVLTLLAFWAFADRLVEAPVDMACAAVPPIALGLFLLAVVGDVFAGESRRGTIAFLRRLPGGMRHAFAAKLLVTLAGSALTIAWQALLLWTSWWLWSRSYLPTAGGVVHAAFTSPFLLPVATVGAFVLLASTWLQHGGMAILLAPMLLGALLAPAVVWGRANPVFARWALGSGPWDLVLPVVLGVAGTAVLAAAASFLGGRRVVRPAWAAAWRGLAVLLVLVGGAYAYGAWQVHDALDFRPGGDDARITKAFLGRGGRTLFVEARHERQGRWRGHGYDTLSRVWAVDLGTGSMRTIGGLGETIEHPPHAGRWGLFPDGGEALEPLPYYVQRRCDAEGRVLEAWLDGTTGEVRKVVASGVRTPDVTAWLDAAAAVATRTRDAEDRRVWLRSMATAEPGDPFGRPGLCVPGETPRALGRDNLRLWQAETFPGGWAVRPMGSPTWSVVDPADGSLRPLPVPYGSHAVLSPTRCLWRGADPRERAHIRWFVIDLDGDAALRPAPGLEPVQGEVAGVLDVDCVLTLAGEPGVRVLCTWDANTGAHEPLAWSSPWPSPVLPVQQASKLRYAAVIGHRADGSVLLQVGWGESDSGMENPSGVAGSSLITVERETRTATCVVPLCGSYPQVVAYEADGAVTVIEQWRRIVRWGPEPGQREVLFPR